MPQRRDPGLSAGEIKVLRFIARREERGDPSPGMREICCATGLEGSRAAQERLSGLICGGYLVQDAGWSRMLELTEHGWRLLEALDASGDDPRRRQEDSGLLDAELLRSPGGAMRRLLRPTPRSLVQAGMSGEELLVVEETPHPADGELLVALVGGETVMVRACRSDGVLGLLPATDGPGDPADGPCGEPPTPASEAEIQGRVIYVVRPLLM